MFCGHFLAVTFDFTTFSPNLLRDAPVFTAWLFLQGSHFFLYGIKGPNASLRLSLSVIIHIFDDRDYIRMKMLLLFCKF